jgi:hypothetical protein
MQSSFLELTCLLGYPKLLPDLPFHVLALLFFMQAHLAGSIVAIIPPFALTTMVCWPSALYTLGLSMMTNMTQSLFWYSIADFRKQPFHLLHEVIALFCPYGRVLFVLRDSLTHCLSIVSHKILPSVPFSFFVVLFCLEAALARTILSHRSTLWILHGHSLSTKTWTQYTWWVVLTPQFIC